MTETPQKVVALHAGVTISDAAAPPNADVVETLEELLAMAKAGSLRGIACAAEDIGACIVTRVTSETGLTKLLGGVHVLADQIVCCIRDRQ